MHRDLEQLKQRIPLLQYLQRRNWTGCRVGARDEFVGLCPLRPETRPSFYVNARKNLFYCHGCHRGGDLIRFVELSQHLSFRESLACLQQDLTLATESELLARTVAFFQLQLHRYSEAVRYLQQRGLQDPDLIAELSLGYAPGGNLRRHLTDLGYSCDLLLRSGLINHQGRDAYIAFDDDVNQAGQTASRRLARQLENSGLHARIVRLPPGHDPNSYFATGATPADFLACL